MAPGAPSYSAFPDPFFIGSGVVDVAFLDGTAYALVTGVGPELEGDDVVGIDRMDGPNSFTIVGPRRVLRANPPATDFFVPTGFQYAMQSFRAEGLDRPTSLEVIKNTAYVAAIGGEIRRIANIAGPPF